MKAEETKAIYMQFCITARICAFVYPNRTTQIMKPATKLPLKRNKIQSTTHEGNLHYLSDFF
jgi:hypothetical protein